jgi:hypothetical protein
MKFFQRLGTHIANYLTADRDHLLEDPLVEPPTLVGHSQWQGYLLQTFNKPGTRILEVGSREVTGESRMRAGFSDAEYIGFDFHPGKNVDVVGDAHRLSSYFSGEDQFDLIFTSACFEHFAMPWVVAIEISKMLKTGGTVFVETHFSFSSHERPWNFFQFSDNALKVLFGPATGFECLDSGMSNPIAGRFSSRADKKLRMQKVHGLYCHSEYLGRKVRDVGNLDWSTQDLEILTERTTYPEPS